MREFFKGWRRKVGCVTLVMALAACGVWMRGHFVADTVSIASGSLTERQICFCNRGIVLVYLAETESGNGLMYPRFDWASERYPDRHYPGEIPSPIDAIADDGVWGFGYYGQRNGYESFQIVIIPFLSVTAPLTLLSAYLLLWPGKRVTKQAAKE